MGAAWRGVRDGTPKFEQVLETVREVSRLGMEVCVTLGQIGPAEARKLKAAGVTAYNHNIDTSPEFYPEIVSTHTFADRLNTIAAVQEFAGTMRSKPAAFSLLELVIAIAILATLLLPVISTLRARAQRAQCAANLRNLYVAANLYLQEKGKLAADPADERRRFGFAGLRETMDRSAQALWRPRRHGFAQPFRVRWKVITRNRRTSARITSRCPSMTNQRRHINGRASRGSRRLATSTAMAISLSSRTGASAI